MACKSSCITLLLLFATLNVAISGDPDILTDFVPPPRNAIANATFFTYTGLRDLINGPFPTVLTQSKVTIAEFPALNGQGVSYAVLQFPGGSINPPHTRPRASGLLFLIHGSLEVGFVDTANKLFTQTLRPGDLFIFPKGLLHYQYNPDTQNTATAIVSFGTAGTGSVSMTSVFSTGIDDNILAKSFSTDVATVQILKAADGLASPP